MTWAGHPAGVRRDDSSFLRGADALVHCVFEIPVGEESSGINPHGGIHDIGGFASGLLIPGFGAEGFAAGLLVKAANRSLTRIVEEGAATVAAGPAQRPQGPQGRDRYGRDPPRQRPKPINSAYSGKVFGDPTIGPDSPPTWTADLAAKSPTVSGSPARASPTPRPTR